jgi:hypothetical protein
MQQTSRDRRQPLRDQRGKSTIDPVRVAVAFGNGIGACIDPLKARSKADIGPWARQTLAPPPNACHRTPCSLPPTGRGSLRSSLRNPGRAVCKVATPDRSPPRLPSRRDIHPTVRRLDNKPGFLGIFIAASRGGRRISDSDRAAECALMLAEHDLRRKHRNPGHGADGELNRGATDVDSFLVGGGGVHSGRYQRRTRLGHLLGDAWRGRTRHGKGGRYRPRALTAGSPLYPATRPTLPDFAGCAQRRHRVRPAWQSKRLSGELRGLVGCLAGTSRTRWLVTNCVRPVVQHCRPFRFVTVVPNRNALS